MKAQCETINQVKLTINRRYERPIFYYTMHNHLSLYWRVVGWKGLNGRADPKNNEKIKKILMPRRCKDNLKAEGKEGWKMRALIKCGVIISRFQKLGEQVTEIYHSVLIFVLFQSYGNFVERIRHQDEYNYFCQSSVMLLLLLLRPSHSSIPGDY